MCKEKEDTIIKIMRKIITNIKEIDSKLKWEPLKNDNEKVLLWDYNKEEKISVVYRFVMGKSDDNIYTIYVGSGGNLSGSGKPTSLVHQYTSGNHKKTREEIEKKINKFKGEEYNAWTEIINLDKEEPANKNKREIIENLMILRFWAEYLCKSKKGGSKIPRFINQKIDLLEGIVNDLDI